jgi:N-acetylglucosamine kinase-like BadF-type ATPase
MVDAINGSSDRLNIQEILGISSVTRNSQTTAGESTIQSDKAQFSLIGQLVSTAKAQGASDEDLEAFRIKIMEAIKNGNFDAVAMAQEAPDALKQASEETGIDLSSALESMAEEVKSRQGMMMPPPPPPPAGDESDEDSEDSTTTASEIMELVDAARAAGASDEELEEFREMIMGAIQSGHFDAKTLAAQASDALKQAAEANGIDLSSALQSMSDDFEARRGMVPPPPPQQSEDESQLLQ